MTRAQPTLALLTGLTLVVGCATPPRPDPWFGQDKFKHFAGSALIAGTATLAAANGGTDNGESLPIGVGVALTFGVGKETYDAHKPGGWWSWRDLVWDLVGALVGAGVAAAD